MTRVATLLMLLALPATAVAETKTSLWVGPDRCVECHQLELHAWKASHHQTGYFTMHRAANAKAIADGLAIGRIKRDPGCIACHYTPDPADPAKTLAGVSCESCHGPARDWIDVHADFGGKEVTAANESPAHAARRRDQSVASGMNAPFAIYDLARRCFSCHVMADERLVNVGKHSARSAFELVSWSQGEVRHNYFYSADKKNRPAKLARIRGLYVLGQALALEHALDGLAGANVGVYRDELRILARESKAALQAIAGKVRLAELDEINKAGAIDVAADATVLRDAARAIGASARKLSTRADQIDLSMLDPLLPKPSTYRGHPLP